MPAGRKAGHSPSGPVAGPLSQSREFLPRLSVCSDGLRLTQGAGLGYFQHQGTELYLEALKRAVDPTGRVLEIFNTDQGCRFTSAEWTGPPQPGLGVKISMDGKGLLSGGPAATTTCDPTQTHGSLHSGEARLSATHRGALRLHSVCPISEHFAAAIQIVIDSAPMRGYIFPVPSYPSLG